MIKIQMVFCWGHENAFAPVTASTDVAFLDNFFG